VEEDSALTEVMTAVLHCRESGSYRDCRAGEGRGAHGDFVELRENIRVTQSV
jgi:hypothetical protein